ncbi:MAG: hypothetical protein ACI8UO_001718 [Verrucomicrobiales bacterium]
MTPTNQKSARELSRIRLLVAAQFRTMNRTSNLTCILFTCLALATPAMAQDKLLPPTYFVGKEYVFLIDQEMVIDVSAISAAFGGEADKVAVIANLVLAATCKTEPDANQKRVSYQTKRLQIQIEGNGLDLDYDTDESGAENTLVGQQLGPLEHMSFGMILNEKDEVVEATDLDVFRNSGGRFFNPEQLMEAVNLTLRLGIPPAGVALGEEWKSSSTMDLGSQVGDLKLEFEVKYERDEEVDGADCAVLNFTADINMNLRNNGGDPDAPRLQVKLEENSATGQMKIDKKLRFFREGSLDLDLTMSFDPTKTLTIPVTLKQTLKLSEVKDL